MAKKKIYAVRKGHKTGLFETWAECQKATSGYSGAEFRGFTDREEAMAFLQMSTTANVSKDCLLYTSPSPRDTERSRMPSSA